MSGALQKNIFQSTQWEEEACEKKEAVEACVVDGERRQRHPISKKTKQAKEFLRINN